MVNISVILHCFTYELFILFRMGFADTRFPEALLFCIWDVLNGRDVLVTGCKGNGAFDPVT